MRFFVRISGGLEQLPLPLGLGLGLGFVGYTFPNQLLLKDKYFFSAAVVLEEISLLNKH